MNLRLVFGWSMALATVHAFFGCNQVLLAHEENHKDHCTLTLELVDAQSGNTVSGLIQIHTAEGEKVQLPHLIDRGMGLPAEAAIHDWYVLVSATELQVPRGKIRLRGFAGLDTELAEVELDLSEKSRASHRLEMRRFYPSRELGWQSANTHVHLRDTTRPETDRYLIECSKADDLDVVFVSYLARPSEHVHYSTNAYTRAELQALSDSHTHFDNGEEHRHNFTPWEEGYGHVMLLDIPELIEPVSIGPGITDAGTDGTPLRVGIDTARSFGGRVIWCHNAWGLEDIPSWLAGRLDANNIFDGGTHGSYQHSFYRYLNIGLMVPFSTGTDWFIYDFSRVYVQSPTRLSPVDWLDQLAAGRSYISNGPLLEFSVAGKGLGHHHALDSPGKVKIQARGLGRRDFQRIEVVMNGQVIQTAESHAQAGHFEASMDVEIAIHHPAWLALRTPPPSAPEMGLLRPTPVNEYGHELFSHSSAVFVDVQGQRVFDNNTAQELLMEMKQNRELIKVTGKFADEQELNRVLSIHDEAIQSLTEIVDSRQTP